MERRAPNAEDTPSKRVSSRLAAEAEQEEWFFSLSTEEESNKEVYAVWSQSYIANLRSDTRDVYEKQPILQKDAKIKAFITGNVDYVMWVTTSDSKNGCLGNIPTRKLRVPEHEVKRFLSRNEEQHGVLTHVPNSWRTKFDQTYSTKYYQKSK